MKKLIASVMINTIVATSVSAIGVDAAEKVEQEKQLECLALNVYYETHARSLADSMSVTDVVLNRVESTRYPNTPCEVVHQGYKKGNRYCQFSWYCDGKSDVGFWISPESCHRKTSNFLFLSKKTKASMNCFLCSSSRSTVNRMLKRRYMARSTFSKR